MFPDRRDTESEPVPGHDPDARSDGSLDDTFELLSDPERRHALYYLYLGDSDAASLAELVDYVVARGADAVADLEDDDGARERLRETHLPELEDAGVVEYDARSGDVRYRGRPVLEQCLALALRLEGD